MALPIRTLRAADLALFDQHFARHRAESGQGEDHFMPYAPDDDDGPKSLDARLFELPLDAPGWQRWWVAWSAHGDKIVGHVDVQGDRLKTGLHRCELGIGIERPYRGQGLGRRLMQAAIDFARAAPALDWLDLRVFAHNASALALYEGLGFQQLGTVPDRFRIDSTAVDDVAMTLEVRAM